MSWRSAVTCATRTATSSKSARARASWSRWAGTLRNSSGPRTDAANPSERRNRTSSEGSAPSQEGNGGAFEGVTPLELFFDLVFVFAFTQVTGFLAHHLTWVGMLQGAALLAALWWAWVTYSWLTNAVSAEERIPARIVILSAMAALLAVSLAIPDAFGDDGVLFGFSYFVVRLLQVALYAVATSAVATSDEPETSQAILRLAPGFLGGPALLVVAGFLDGLAQGALWAAALAIDYGVPLVRGVVGFRIRASSSATGW